jgi:cytochrome oxidase Cu insertion factor (SCO1/SenC/PrrC family)
MGTSAAHRTGIPPTQAYSARMISILVAAVLAVGQLAPNFTLPDQNGKRVTLSATRGQKVVLFFYRGFW